MSDSIILQSYRSHDIPEWIATCMQSVANWASHHAIDYHCADDEEILSRLPPSFARKVTPWPMRTDLARLQLSQHFLKNGYQRVIWLDADVLIHQPHHFQLPKAVPDGYAFGREIWIDNGGKVRRGVHNALCYFQANNPFLDYYIHCCQRIIEIHKGKYLAPQLLGPKLLKSHFSYLNFHLLDQVNMLSPAVVHDVISGGGPHLEKQLAEHFAPASNLCHSLLEDREAAKCVECLLKNSTDWPLT